MPCQPPCDLIHLPHQNMQISHVSFSIFSHFLSFHKLYKPGTEYFFGKWSVMIIAIMFLHLPRIKGSGGNNCMLLSKQINKTMQTNTGKWCCESSGLAVQTATTAATGDIFFNAAALMFLIVGNITC